MGRAKGETFYAPQTVISSITLWRPPGVNGIGAHIFITTVDTNRTPHRPITQGIIRDGPVLHIVDSDPPGGIVKMQFVFDPPVVLPGRGEYAWFMQTEDCNPGDLRLLATTLNPYPYGMRWRTGRALTECALAPAEDPIDYIDLIFEIDFCDNVTGAYRSSWGRVKAIYR